MTGMLSRRSALKAAAAAIAAPYVFSRGVAQAQQQRFTVMALGGSWGAAIKEYIGVPFGKTHGLQMTYDERANAQQLAALQAMRANPSVHVVELGSTRMGQAIALGLVSPIDPAKAPNYAAVDPKYKNPYYADRYNAAWALTINTKRIDPARALAEGWNIMLDPKLKGRVALPKFGWMGEMWMHAANLTLGGSYDNFDPMVAFGRKAVRENGALVMESNDQGLKLFTNDEIWAAPFWVGRTFAMIDQGAPLASIYCQGWTAYGSGFMVVKGTGAEDLATKFVDLSLSPEVQVPIARKFSYSPTNTLAMPMVSDVPRLQIGAADMARVQALDYEKMYLLSDKYLERVNQEVLG